MSSAATSRLRPPPPTVDPRPRGTGGPDTARIRPADPGTASRVAAVDDPDSPVSVLVGADAVSMVEAYRRDLVRTWGLSTPD